MKKDCYILVSESKIGIHSDINNNNKEDVFIFSMQFPPVVRKDGLNKLFFYFNGNNSTYLQLKGLYSELSSSSKYEKVTILVGFDLDEAGEAMSCALRENLIKDGVKSDYIMRTPLTEQGYIAMKEFSESEKYKEYLYLQQNFLLQQRQNNIKNPVGFQKANSMEILIKYKGKSSFVNTKNSKLRGTSTSTVATKFILEKSDG